jgi:hypothetical protein
LLQERADRAPLQGVGSADSTSHRCGTRGERCINRGCRRPGTARATVIAASPLFLMIALRGRVVCVLVLVVVVVVVVVVENTQVRMRSALNRSGMMRIWVWVGVGGRHRGRGAVVWFRVCCVYPASLKKRTHTHAGEDDPIHGDEKESKGGCTWPLFLLSSWQLYLGELWETVGLPPSPWGLRGEGAGVKERAPRG